MKIKKLIAGAFFALLGTFAHAQGLQQVLVEKYYISNVADSLQADADIIQYNSDNGTSLPIGALPVGSVTYRLYADMLPGYEIISVYADVTKSQNLVLTTSTNFYNHPVGTKSPVPGTAKAAIKNNLLALDTYYSMGGLATGQYGIPKSFDNGAANNVTVAANPGGVLLNNHPDMGIALTTQDGMIAGAGIIPAGDALFTPAHEAVFNDGTVLSNSFVLNDGSWNNGPGAVGAVAADNHVLIAQITTNGTFHYEFNILVKPVAVAVGEFYATNPAPGDLTCPGISGTFGSNVAPTVNIDSPLNGANFLTGAVVAISATAADADGTVAQVEFFVDGVSLSVDNTGPAPYTASYPATAGTHTLTAKATDNAGAQTTSASVVITAHADPAPTVTIDSPLDGASFLTGAVVPISATATDAAPGSVTQVEFFVDGTSLSVDNSSPYTASYTSVAGTHTIVARATDNGGAHASDTITINVQNDPAPTVVINTPANGANFLTGAVVAIAATATDAAPGTITGVEFFVDGVSLSVDNSSPYAASYNSVAGTHTIVARATDNGGAQASDTVTINVQNDPAPTVNITAPLNGASFTIGDVVSISATANDAVPGTVTQVAFLVDGSPLSVDNSGPSYTASYVSTIGTHTLTAIATDNIGQQSVASNVVINVLNGNTKYTIGTVSATCPATGFCLPVTALISVSDVIGYEMIIQYDKLKVVPTGSITVSNSLVNPSFVETAKVIDAANGRITVLAYLNASAPVSTRFAGSGVVLTIGFSTLPGFAAVDTALFSMISLKENYLTAVTPAVTGPGKFFTYKDSIFHSGLRFWSDNQPIKYDALNPGTYLITNIYGNNASCTALSAVAVQPNLLGNFDYNSANGTSVSIRRDIAPTTSVISVINDMDATLVRDIVLGIYPSPSVYQIIAADVNRDSEVNTNDITQIYWRSVLSIGEFAQKTSPVLDWVFLDSSVTLASPAYKISATYPADNGVGYSKHRVPVAPFCLPVPKANLNACSDFSPEIYRGVLIGDFNGSYAGIAPDGQIKKTAGVDPNAKVIFDMSKAVVSGNFMDVPVSFSSTDNIRALNGELKFNETGLSYHSIIKNINDTDMEFRAYYHPDDKTLRFGANTLSKLNANTAVVSIRFNVLSGNVDAADLNPLSGFLNGVPSNIEVTPFIPTAIDDINNYQVVNVYPNPASSVLNVEVSQNAIVELMDATGRQVLVKTSVSANEKQEINVENIANGIYMMKVSNDNFVSVQKVVINK